MKCISRARNSEVASHRTKSYMEVARSPNESLRAVNNVIFKRVVRALYGSQLRNIPAQQTTKICL